MTRKLFIYFLTFIFFISVIVIQPVYGAIRCDSDEYDCVKIKHRTSWKSLFPDERERDIVMRVNHTNRSLYPGMVIRVPYDLSSSNALDFSPLPQQLDHIREKTIIFDPKRHAWGAYDSDGSLIKWGPATGGSSWCKDIGRACRTKAGHFRIFSMGSSNCVSSKFPLPRGGAPMPYCMFFNGGQALHGSPGAVIPGNVSHGCVRLFVQDAEWLRYDFAGNGTRVIVLPYYREE